MGFYQIDTPSIEIDIPDFVSGDTVMKRTATLFTMVYNQEPSIKHVVLTWTVKHFAKNEDGSRGDYLGKVCSDWIKETIADNTTMCDASTGIPIEKVDTGEVDENDHPIFDYDQTIIYMGQYDFFYLVAESQPILVHPMIRDFGGRVQNWDKK